MLNRQVTVYSSNFCGSCEMVKGFLSLRNVEFIVKNVSTDLEGRAELLALGYDSTPIIVIGDQILSEFNVEAIDHAIDTMNEKYPPTWCV